MQKVFICCQILGAYFIHCWVNFGYQISWQKWRKIIFNSPFKNLFCRWFRVPSTRYIYALYRSSIQYYWSSQERSKKKMNPCQKKERGSITVSKGKKKSPTVQQRRSLSCSCTLGTFMISTLKLIRIIFLTK